MRAGARTDAAAWRPESHPSPGTALPARDTAHPQADLRAVLAALAVGPRLAPAVHAEWRLPAHALWVAMAPDPLAQTLRRLLELAAELLTPIGGVVRIHARAEGTTAAVSVVDEPAGAQPPALARRVHGLSLAADPHQDASLRALALCAQAIDGHHGRLYAAPSTWGAMGATMRLPLIRLAGGLA
ncbi:hypothetical protein [uncultured Pseudacidovorax sp.]|uniref:hypothetical protein n=1 Tax=uncultured Pseudacidovorax sp. TaxID=679313 RepID=UPI0025D7D73B|nr:hypothetical protein [uncultured Pseudacidovorax sp.]